MKSYTCVERAKQIYDRITNSVYFFLSGPVGFGMSKTIEIVFFGPIHLQNATDVADSPESCRAVCVDRFSIRFGATRNPSVRYVFADTRHAGALSTDRSLRFDISAFLASSTARDNRALFTPFRSAPPGGLKERDSHADR